VSSKVSENNSNILSSRDLMEMDINKLREYIKILEDHQIKCEDTGRFVEAEMAKSKIVQFKEIAEDKVTSELKGHQAQQTSQLSIEFKEELGRFNEEWDGDFIALNNKYEKMKEKINSMNKTEIEDKMKIFEETYPKAPKPSKELLNLHSLLDGHVKQKDYKAAHTVQIQILDMQKAENEKHLKVKQEKMEKELAKILTRQETEVRVFEDKLAKTYTEFKKNRALDTEAIIIKYTNKSKELEKTQRFELSDSKKPGKRTDALLRPSSKIAYKNNIAISSSDHKSSDQKNSKII